MSNANAWRNLFLNRASLNKGGDLTEQSEVKSVGFLRFLRFTHFVRYGRNDTENYHAGIACQCLIEIYGLVYFGYFGAVYFFFRAADMLGILRDAGVTRVLVTGSGQRSILDRLDRDYPGIFEHDKRVTALNVSHGKPDPEPYLKGQQLAGCNACEAIVIENAPLGVLAGHRSGCFTVGITTGPIPEADMVASGADIVYRSMPEFAKRLPDLLNAFKL